MATAADTGTTGIRKRIATLRSRLERLLLWRVWERMLEIEFVDRSIALAGKAFVSFFPLVIVIAAFMPEGIRESIVSSVTHRLGIRGDALVTAQGGVRVVGRRSACDRCARPRAHDLLRHLVHDCAAARVPPRVAPPAARPTRRVRARAVLAARDGGVDRAPRSVCAARSAMASDSASSPSWRSR